MRDGIDEEDQDDMIPQDILLLSSNRLVDGCQDQGTFESIIKGHKSGDVDIAGANFTNESIFLENNDHNEVNKQTNNDISYFIDLSEHHKSVLVRFHFTMLCSDYFWLK